LASEAKGRGFDPRQPHQQLLSFSRMSEATARLARPARDIACPCKQMLIAVPDKPPQQQALLIHVI
jgi:hypothetical protein